MLKKTLYIIGLASLVSIMLVGCGKSKAAHHSSTGQTSTSVSTQSSSSTSSSSVSSASTSQAKSTASNVKLSDKTFGVLALEYDRDVQSKGFGQKENHDQFSDYNTVKKPDIHSKEPMMGMFFIDKNSKYGIKNHVKFDQFTANGDGTADLMFNVEPDSVYVQFRDMSKAGNKDMAHVPAVNMNVSKDYLINAYYKTAEQRKHVDNYSKSILSEEVWNKQYDSLSNSDNDD